MKLFIVHAHENSDSFSSSLCKETKSKFESKGHQVNISDLYAIGFDPVASKHDFKHDTTQGYYKYAFQQLAAVKEGTFSHDIKTEMDKLVEADMLNFNFPLWWFGVPAILKGWIDRVLAYGFAYGGEYGMGETGRFKGKKAFITVTTGSPEEVYKASGRNKRTVNDILTNIHQGVFELIGFEAIAPFVAYGVSRSAEEDRKLILSQHSDYLEQFCFD